jgi:hypothetical protein
MDDNDSLGGEGGAQTHAQNLDAQAIDAGRQEAHRRLYGIDWEAIEREYVHGDKSLDRISAIYGPSGSAIRKYAKAGGWVRLVGTKPLRGGRPPRRPGQPVVKPPSVKLRRQQSFIKRLFKLLDNRLKAMEERMADTHANLQELSAGEIEREARAVSTIASCYAKIVELEEAARKAGQVSETSAVRSAEDADRLRRDLAERLMRLTPVDAPQGS